MPLRSITIQLAVIILGITGVYSQYYFIERKLYEGSSLFPSAPIIEDSNPYLYDFRYGRAHKYSYHPESFDVESKSILSMQIPFIYTNDVKKQRIPTSLFQPAEDKVNIKNNQRAGYEYKFSATSSEGFSSKNSENIRQSAALLTPDSIYSQQNYYNEVPMYGLPLQPPSKPPLRPVNQAMAPSSSSKSYLDELVFVPAFPESSSSASGGTNELFGAAPPALGESNVFVPPEGALLAPSTPLVNNIPLPSPRNSDYTRRRQYLLYN